MEINRYVSPLTIGKPLYNCRVLLHSGHTLVIPHENESSLAYFKREVATQSNPESFFYSWERPVRVKDISEIVSIEEEN